MAQGVFYVLDEKNKALRLDLRPVRYSLPLFRFLLAGGSGLVYCSSPVLPRLMKILCASKPFSRNWRGQSTIIAGNNWKEHELILTSRVGTPIHYRNLLRDFQLLLQRAGLPIIRFHDLRHTAAALMLNHGIPVIVVSRRLGHAKPSITMDVYGHLLPSMQAEVAQQIDEWITPVELKDVNQLHQTAPNLHPI